MYNDVVPTRYSIADARAHLADIVSEALEGHSVELTRHGKPVAVVLSVDELQRLRAGRTSFADAFRRYRDRYGAAASAADEDAFANVRDRSVGREVDL